MALDPAATPAIAAVGLVKRYREVSAVGGVDFQVGGGECFGLLGPSGAGKTMRFTGRGLQH